MGSDRCQTKTGNDRRISLCSRVRAVLKRQLALRNRLQAAGRIQHEHVILPGNQRTVHEPADPGPSVARDAEHGHSIRTMLRVYAAWAQGLVESDIAAMRRSMSRHAPLRLATCRTTTAANRAASHRKRCHGEC